MFAACFVVLCELLLCESQLVDQHSLVAKHSLWCKLHAPSVNERKWILPQQVLSQSQMLLVLGSVCLLLRRNQLAQRWSLMLASCASDAICKC